MKTAQFTAPNQPSRHDKTSTDNRGQEFRALFREAFKAVDEKINDYTDPSCFRVPSEQKAFSVAVEIERRLRSTKTPHTIFLCHGDIHPTEEVELFVKETPVIANGHAELPDWAIESTTHTWVEVDISGTSNRFLIDGFVPPQLTGHSEFVIRTRIYKQDSVTDRPENYPQNAETHRLSSFTQNNQPETVWSAQAPAWPNQTKRTTPADGGDEIAPDRNSICKIETRKGINLLPNNSIYTIMTSPPYRLLRSYNAPDTIYGGSESCDHDWKSQIIKTDTPVREDGCAGFGPGDESENQYSERHRNVDICAECDAYRGQLGHEPKLEQFIEHLVSIFDQTRRVLKDTGSLYVNIADSYDAYQRIEEGTLTTDEIRESPGQKSLIGLPERFMIAMMEAGWYCREHYIWVKPDATTEGRAEQSRARKAHEHIFRFVIDPDGYVDTGNGPETNVLEIPTASGVPGATPAMPLELPERLLQSVAIEDEKQTVLDPFAGSGTVLEAAARHNMDYLGFDISDDAIEIAKDRLEQYSMNSASLSGQQSLQSFVD